MKNIIYGILLLLLLESCNNNNSDNNTYKANSKDDNLDVVSANNYKDNETSGEDDRSSDVDSNLFPDDIYTAEIGYYNPNTGTLSNYTLEVEVEDNIVNVIHFNNGGWLDESHIVSGGELNENGEATINTDKGYEYSIKIEK
jgi:hypothetical protein